MVIDDVVEAVRDGEWLIVRWRGEIDMSNARPIQQATLHGMENTDKGMIVDLAGVTYIDSAGIRSLVSIRRMLEERQQRLLLVVPVDSLLSRALQIGGVPAAISTYSSVDEAERDR